MDFLKHCCLCRFGEFWLHFLLIDGVLVDTFDAVDTTLLSSISVAMYEQGFGDTTLFVGGIDSVALYHGLPVLPTATPTPTPHRGGGGGSFPDPTMTSTPTSTSSQPTGNSNGNGLLPSSCASGWLFLIVTVLGLVVFFVSARKSGEWKWRKTVKSSLLVLPFSAVTWFIFDGPCVLGHGNPWILTWNICEIYWVFVVVVWVGVMVFFHTRK